MNRPSSAAQAGEAANSPAELPADAVVLGRVSGAWGVRGWIRVTPFNDPRDSILIGQRRWWLRGRSGSRALEILQARAHGDEIVARLDGVDDRESAQALKGSEVLVSRAAFPETPPGEVYWIDLIGCAVRNPGGEPLGVVVAVDEFGAHPVLRLDTTDAAGKPGPQRLIPFIPERILEIDLAGRQLVADWEPDY